MCTRTSVYTSIRIHTKRARSSQQPQTACETVSAPRGSAQDGSTWLSIPAPATLSSSHQPKSRQGGRAAANDKGMHGLRRSVAPALRSGARVQLAAAAPRRAAYHAQAGGGAMTGFDYREMHGTTVLCLQRGNKAVIIADGQVSMGSAVFKASPPVATRSARPATRHRW